MKEIKLTQGQVALVDDIDYGYLMQWKWYAGRYYKSFRPARADKSTGKVKTLFMYTVVAERMGIDTTQIDHKDRNPLNNCRYNLRAATYSQNLHNRGTPKTNSTGVKGVHFDKSRGKYKAKITVEGKYHFFGRFDTLEEAAAVVQHKREELVGEFTCH